MKISHIECPICQTHEDMEVKAYIGAEKWGPGNPVAKLEFICPYCKRRFDESKIVFVANKSLNPTDKSAG